MSYKNLMRMASLLLASLMLLASCAKEEIPVGTDDGVVTEAPQESEASPEVEKEPQIGPVDPVLKNFFTFKSVTPYKNLTSAERMDGELSAKSADDGMLVLRNAEIDHMNQAKETYTVHNTELGKTVLTLEHTYTYRKNYSSFDWTDLCVQDPTVCYPESVLDVRLLSVDSIDLIEVRRAKIAPREEPEAGEDIYLIETTYEYYDAAGTKLTESRTEAYPYLYSKDPEGSAIRVADVSVLVDADTGLAMSVTEADGGVIRLGYSDQTEKYGYYLNQRQTSANGSSRAFLEVYDRATGERVLRYYPEECSGFSAFVMQNGDICLQSLTEAEEGAVYDMNLSGINYTVKNEILDVSTGEVSEIALSYLLLSMDDRTEFSEIYDMESKGIYVTENAVNICVAAPIENKTVSISSLRVIVLNNDGGLLYEVQPIVPEHYISVLLANPMGFTISPKGDYIVSLDGVVSADRAIVSADGRLRAYLRPEAQVVGEYVVMPDGIYDYDLKNLYRFEENGYQLEAVIGTRIIVSEISATTASAGTARSYYELMRRDNKFETRALFDGSAKYLEVVEKDYLIIRDSKTDKYSIYNTSLNHILTTQSPMRVSLLEDRYIVATDIVTATGSVSVFYTLSE